MKNLRIVVTLLMITLFAMSSFAQSELEGEWIVGEKNTVVKIEQQNGVHYGKIISSDNPKAKVGQLMVSELKQTKGKWKGEIYSAQREDWYDAEFSRKGNILKVKISAGFISKTIEWTQAQP